MSAELIKSKFVHRPSVAYVATISESVKMCRFLTNFSCNFLPLGHTLGRFFKFLNKARFPIIRIFSILVNMGPNGNKNVKTLLPRIAFKLFQNFSSQYTSQKYCFGFF